MRCVFDFLSERKSQSHRGQAWRREGHPIAQHAELTVRRREAGSRRRSQSHSPGAGLTSSPGAPPNIPRFRLHHPQPQSVSSPGVRLAADRHDRGWPSLNRCSALALESSAMNRARRPDRVHRDRGPSDLGLQDIVSCSIELGESSSASRNRLALLSARRSTRRSGATFRTMVPRSTPIRPWLLPGCDECQEVWGRDNRTHPCRRR